MDPQTTKKHEEFKVEDGDSDSDKSPHRNGNYAGNYQLPRIDDPLPTSPRGGEGRPLTPTLPPWKGKGEEGERGGLINN